MNNGPTDGDGPFDGLNDDDDDGKDKKRSTNLIVLPGGKKVSPSKIGANYVVGQVGDIPTAEIVDPANLAEEVKARRNYVNNQPLVRASKDKTGAGQMMDLLVQEITEELAHLKYERRLATKGGKNTANYSVGRMNSLKNLAELIMKRREADRDEELDLRSARFQAVFKIWMEFFGDSMEKSGIEPKVIDLVFNQMKADMVDWEKKMSMV